MTTAENFRLLWSKQDQTLNDPRNPQQIEEDFMEKPGSTAERSAKS
jgi:hypothetical protein